MKRLVLALLLAASPAFAQIDKNGNGVFQFQTNSGAPTRFVISDATQRPIFMIDSTNKKITVPDDVDVNETARQVLEAITSMSCYGAK